MIAQKKMMKMLMKKRATFNISRTLSSFLGTNNDLLSLRKESTRTLFTHNAVKKEKTYWQPEDNDDIQRVTQIAMIHELTQQQTRTIQTIVPWFLDNMPAAYFRQVPFDFRIAHMKAIAAVKDFDMSLYLNLKSNIPNGEVLTFIRPGYKAGRLSDLIKELPWSHNTDYYQHLSRMQIFSAKDESLSLSMFIYGDANENNFDVNEIGANILAYAEKIQRGEFLSCKKHPLPSKIFEKEEIKSYLSKCSETYISRMDPLRFFQHRELHKQVSGTEGTAIRFEEHENNQIWVDIAVANSLSQVALENAARLLHSHEFEIDRAHLDVVSDGENGNITLLRLLISQISQEKPSSASLDIFKKELTRSKWLDSSTMALALDKYPRLGIERSEIITAICSLLHPIMAKKNNFMFSKANILETVTSERYIPHASNIADLFLDRFNPVNPLPEDEFKFRCQILRVDINNSVEDTNAEELLHKMIDVVENTLKTNIYLESRYALCFRLDPKLMHKSENHEVPYGVFFVHGRRFNGYHVRFRDIARGGMRLVTPGSAEQYALESARQYDECYGLAYAQQLKNKDIPEGGSKAVILVNSSKFTPTGRDFVARKSIKAFTDSLLDLIVDTDETRERMVDLIGKRELLYLGPDEQVIPDDINWVVQRAAKRGYDTPAAFMSSKPKAGINHKEYGVTSEGVNVYLDVALRESLGIDPNRQEFSVKMTGGTDGDVGGNEIKILIREYRENAKIVGIADGTGSAEDPYGLDHSELLRLVEESLPIAHFDKQKLSEKGTLNLVSSEEGVKMRNTMHNRVIADAFIPCGGRPNTIDIHNYKNYLKEDGSPSAPLIVEAANLFITEEARTKLFEEAGVIIVKDSSANKCGVITSSFEICAAMLLSETEFTANKEKIVEEILAKLRKLAKMEATILMKEFQNYPGSLPHVSKVISKAINTVKDEVLEALDTMTNEEMELLMPLFRAHLPETLADLSFDRVVNQVPKQYIRNALASCIASKIVYKEGSKFIEFQPRKNLAKMALTYIEKEKEVTALAQALREAKMPEEEKEKILALMEAGGARTALTML